MMVPETKGAEPMVIDDGECKMYFSVNFSVFTLDIVFVANCFGLNRYKLYYLCK